MAFYDTGTGQKLIVHRRDECSGRCPIHNPSDHPLKDAPTHWREDRSIMERICEHGIGHPDPDDTGYKVIERGEPLEYIDVHGCDGCCQG
jgi:hypothetical protein